MKTHFTLLLGFIVGVLLTSCSAMNVYTRQAGLGIDSSLLVSQPHMLQADDKISLSVSEHDDLSIGSVFGIYNSNEVYGKWVLIDDQGDVVLPRLGRVHLGGLSTRQAEDSVSRWLSRSIVHPIVKLKVLNRTVSVVGEVKTPGQLVLEKERNTVMETLARAGDFDYYADKRSVRLERLTPAGRKSYQLDFTKMPDAYKAAMLVQAGDVIYVPTRSGKMLDKKAPTLIPFSSLVTTLAILAKLVF